MAKDYDGTASAYEYRHSPKSLLEAARRQRIIDRSTELVVFRDSLFRVGLWATVAWLVCGVLDPIYLASRVDDLWALRLFGACVFTYAGLFAHFAVARERLFYLHGLLAVSVGASVLT